MKNNQKKTLEECFELYGCDKSYRHHYHTVYEKFLEEKRDTPIRILEVGILKGESINAWLEYFPNIEVIYGIDTFERVKVENIPVLKNPRVKYLKGDSTKCQLQDKYLGYFDVIIDDGLHSPEFNGKTFKNLSKYLKKDGLYFIEDVWPIDIMTEKEMKHPWVLRHKETRYNKKYFDFFMSCINDKTKWVIERFDNRKLSGAPDSYVFLVKPVAETKKTTIEETKKTQPAKKRTPRKKKVLTIDDTVSDMKTPQFVEKIEVRQTKKEETQPDEVYQQLIDALKTVKE